MQQRFLGLVVVLPGVASAVVNIDWVSVGDPGNAGDTTGYGAVAYEYRISRYEVANTDYAEFLNAVAATDTYGLYNPGQGAGFGGITRSGSSGSYTYSVIAGRESKPVNHVSFYDSLRFANWLHNDQSTGAQDSTTTEDGAYDMSLGSSAVRKVGAKVFLTSEHEWYKAAYYDTGAVIYFDYPALSDTQTTCAVPGATANTANCDSAVGDLTDAGDYTSSPSPNGTFDQGGNVWEWNEAGGGQHDELRPLLSQPGHLLAHGTGRLHDLQFALVGTGPAKNRVESRDADDADLLVVVAVRRGRDDDRARLKHRFAGVAPDDVRGQESDPRIGRRFDEVRPAESNLALADVRDLVTHPPHAFQQGLRLSTSFRSRIVGEIAAVQQNPRRFRELLLDLIDDPRPPGEAPRGAPFSPAGIEVADDVSRVEQEQRR